MIDFYNIASHNKQLTPEEVQKEASKSRPAWAVCHTIDHTAPGCQQDDHRDKVRTVAIFNYPCNAEDFIKKCLPAENHEKFYIVRLDPELEKVKEAARRLYAFMDPWERCETTEEETAEEIRKNPIDAILYLLDAVEN